MKLVEIFLRGLSRRVIQLCALSLPGSTKGFLMMGALFAGSLGSSWSLAQTLEGYQQQWSQAMYQVAQDKREPLLSDLVEELRAAVAAEPNNPRLLIWEGIVLSTLAGERGGLGALSLVKEAKAAFEASLALDPVALGGSAATSLGSLYHQVPGWPIAFGSDKKALRYLEQGLEANPQGIDANFFIAQYWIAKDRSQVAKKYLLVAQQAEPRAGRMVADAGRLTEIQNLLQQLPD